MSVHAPIHLRCLGYAGMLLAALPFLTATPAAAQAGSSRLALARGSVEVGRGEPAAWQPAREGESLGAGDAVRTGHDGRAEIDLGGATARLYENSLLRLPAADASGVELEEGASLFDVLRRREGESPFEVRTREVVVSVKGTRFGVGVAGGSAAVSVYRGLVGVLGAGAAPETEILVRDGFAASGDPAHGLELSVLPDFDAWEAWASGDAAPAPPLAPASASAELEAAREAARRDVESEVRALGAAADPAPERAGPAKLRDERKAARDARERSPGEGEPADRKVAPAALDAADLADATPPAADPLKVEIDPVTAARSQHEKEALEDQVTDAIVENALVDPASAGGSATHGALPFSIEWITSGGPNHVVIEEIGGGVLADLTRDEIEEDILEDGQVGLLGPQLLHILDGLDVDPHDFAEKLLDLR